MRFVQSGWKFAFSEETLLLYISECGCWKPIKLQKRPMATNILTRCSQEANLFGSGQKVVSYSLYGEGNSSNVYKKGVLPCLESVREMYPGWVMRIYSNLELQENPDLCDLICNSPDLFWCDVNKLSDAERIRSVFARIWRFVPTDDDLVDIFISRDLDSPISERERGAVAAWEKSDKIFHFMRDHLGHGVPILAGMWGAKVSLIEQEDRKYLLENFLKGSRKNTIGKDQHVLSDYLYTPRFFNQPIAHDEHFCERFDKTNCIKFPSQRNGVEYVGEKWPMNIRQ